MEKEQTQVQPSKAKPNTILLLLIVGVVCIGIGLGSGYFLQKAVTDSLVNGYESRIQNLEAMLGLTSSSSSSASSTVSQSDFSTYSDEYISFDYPKGWSVETKNSVKDPVDQAEYSPKGTYEIKISTNGKSIEMINLGIGGGVDIIKYDTSKPMQLYVQYDPGLPENINNATLKQIPTITKISGSDLAVMVLNEKLPDSSDQNLPVMLIGNLIGTAFEYKGQLSSNLGNNMTYINNTYLDKITDKSANFTYPLNLLVSWDKKDEKGVNNFVEVLGTFLSSIKSKTK